MTYAFVEGMEQKYLGLNHFKMGIWSVPPTRDGTELDHGEAVEL